MKKDRYTVFKSGAIRDLQEGKPDFVEPISWPVEWRYAEYMTEMKKKYGEGNWKKGIPTLSLLQGAFRHLSRYATICDCKKYGHKLPAWSESEVDHLSAAIFNIKGIMYNEIFGEPKQ